MSSEFSLRRRVLFCDTDASGLIHFANIFRYMEECEHRFLQSLNQRVYDTQEEHRIAWPRVHVACDYHKPLRFNDLFEVKLLVREVGESSVAYQFQFRRDDNELLCAVGDMTVVCVEETAEGAYAKRQLPDALRSQIEVAPRSELINV